MVKDLCRFCRQIDDGNNLIDPCDCYKKFDALRVHQKCLQDHISDATAKQRERFNPNLHPEFCSVCRKKYRVKLKWHFGTKRLWTVKSFHSYIEGFVMTITCMMMIFSVYIVVAKESKRSREEGSNEGSGVGFLLPLVVVSLLMFAATVRKIYYRWRANQMEADILDVL
mmetsp:Transcript_21744/g.47764  ORF Transcript_21744/g.47764 Transcript_21744/m.47764 type:complete len:169 (-) Transcript_21744:778-1284(-)